MYGRSGGSRRVPLIGRTAVSCDPERMESLVAASASNVSFQLIYMQQKRPSRAMANSSHALSMGSTRVSIPGRSKNQGDALGIVDVECWITELITELRRKEHDIYFSPFVTP